MSAERLNILDENMLPYGFVRIDNPTAEIYQYFKTSYRLEKTGHRCSGVVVEIHVHPGSMNGQPGRYEAECDLWETQNKIAPDGKEIARIVISIFNQINSGS